MSVCNEGFGIASILCHWVFYPPITPLPRSIPYTGKKPTQPSMSAVAWRRALLFGHCCVEVNMCLPLSSPTPYNLVAHLVGILLPCLCSPQREEYSRTKSSMPSQNPYS